MVKEKNSETSALAPFLAKTLLLTQSTEGCVADWNEEGKVYIIKDQDQFSVVLKKFFKGTAQTFVRQLHFYGFKKVEVDEKVGVWGFEHEQGLFLRDKPGLVKDIRRKNKVDPESEKLASYYDVQALKSQICFLQQIIEDLRKQVDRLREINELKPLKLKSKEKSKVQKEEQMEGGGENSMSPIQGGIDVDDMEESESDGLFTQRKRPRTKTGSSFSSISSFEQLCANIHLPPSVPSRQSSRQARLLKPQGGKNPDSSLPSKGIVPGLSRSASFGSLPSITSSVDLEMDTFSELFSDLELDEVESMHLPYLNQLSPSPTRSLSPDSGKLDNAVRAISEATKVREADVSKIISFLSTLSINSASQAPSSSTAMKAKAELNGCQAVTLGQLMPIRIQKVGAS